MHEVNSQFRASWALSCLNNSRPSTSKLPVQSFLASRTLRVGAKWPLGTVCCWPFESNWKTICSSEKRSLPTARRPAIKFIRLIRLSFVRKWSIEMRATGAKTLIYRVPRGRKMNRAKSFAFPGSGRPSDSHNSLIAFRPNNQHRQIDESMTARLIKTLKFECLVPNYCCCYYCYQLIERFGHVR